MTVPAPDIPPPPSTELGYVRGEKTTWWQQAEQELTPELRWPQSIAMYDRMRTDAQVTSVLRAVTLPVRRTPWRIDPAGTRDEVAQGVADDLGLPLVGMDLPPPRRTRDRFSWVEHLHSALLMLTYGHAYFEPLYRIDSQGMARLRKLAPRPARTITAVNVASDGGLESIEQRPPGTRNGVLTLVRTQKIVIPVSRLVAYVHEREGGNWLGTSLLRPAYGPFVLKDRALRVQSQTLERNGMGVPIYEGAEGETDLEPGRKMASGYRSGDQSGAATPYGAKLRFAGVEGDLPDADKAIRYYDEQIARAVLAHFLNLGTQTGSWALGSTFADFFTLSLQTLAQQVADVATQHIIEDWVDYNYGPDEPAPRVTFDEIGSKSVATAQALKLLVDAGIVFPDRVLEEAVRQSHGLPSKDSPPPADGQNGDT